METAFSAAEGFEFRGGFELPESADEDSVGGGSSMELVEEGFLFHAGLGLPFLQTGRAARTSFTVDAALFEWLKTLSPSFAPFMSDRDVSAGSWIPQWMEALRTSDACTACEPFLISG